MAVFPYIFSVLMQRKKKKDPGCRGSPWFSQSADYADAKGQPATLMANEMRELWINSSRHSCT